MIENNVGTFGLVSTPRENQIIENEKKSQKTSRVWSWKPLLSASEVKELLLVPLFLTMELGQKRKKKKEAKLCSLPLRKKYSNRIAGTKGLSKTHTPHVPWKKWCHFQGFADNFILVGPGEEETFAAPGQQFN